MIRAVQDPSLMHSPGAATDGATLLLLGWSREEWSGLGELRRAGVHLLDHAEPMAAAEMALTGEVEVVCVGPALPPSQLRAFLDVLSDDGGDELSPLVVIAHTEAKRRFPDLPEEGRLYHLCGDLPAAELFPVVLEALRIRGGERQARQHPSPPVDRELVDLVRRVAMAADAAARSAAIEDGLPSVLDCDRATCFVRVRAGNEMRRGSPSAPVVPAVSGIAGFVVKSGRSVRTERAERDPRFDPRVDDREATGRERVLAAPLVGPREAPVGAVVAVRTGDRPPFGPQDQARLEELGRHAGLYFVGELAQSDGDASSPDPPTAGRDSGSLFRRQALLRHGAGAQADPEVLRLSPAWTRWSYGALLGGMLLLLAFSLLARVHGYARGSAVVAMADQIEVAPRQAGLVAAVDVEVGDVVAAERTLVRLEQSAQSAELGRTDREFELHLVNRLRDPQDPSSAQALIALRGQRLLAEAELESRLLKAPEAGVVTDVRIRPGDYVSPDQVAVTLTPRDSSPRLVLFLPGDALPQISPGMRARVELAGFPYAWQEATLTRVGREAMGPAEARRHLGRGVADSLPIPSSVAVVEADLASTTFEMDGETYPFHSGMVGTAEVRVRSQRLLFALFPQLQRLLP